LGACPFSINGSLSIVGNSSLKSLEGAPELVGGRVYIMKNGKKFTEENIKRIIHIATKIVCSIDLDGDIIEESSINEALNEPHLLELVKQLKDNKIDVKKFFNSKTIPWDQIDAAHVKEYPNIDAKAKTVARNIIAGRDGIKGIILLRNSEDKYTYAISNSKDFIELDRDLVSRWREPCWKDYSSTELMWMVEDSRSMVVITWDSDFVYNRIKMQVQRRDSRLGMVLNTPEYYEEVAKENIRRYKKIIAMNKAKKDDEIEKIDKDIELIMNKSLKMVQGIRQTPTSGASWMNSSKIDKIFDSIYNQSSYGGGETGLLVLYNKFLREYIHVRDNGDSYRERNMNEYKKLLLQKIKTIKSQLGL
jgi:hypothetical protein